ncbi:transmembrane protein 132C [Elysia marginata]|uniref:Transmembrane protein 132C n=1 Tax=Elysia marginata TaxID=1093978 RepID=A0AAV4EAG5_9GAST|nr:transmembrane protein 132C [Elysia marginata]
MYRLHLIQFFQDMAKMNCGTRENLITLFFIVYLNFACCINIDFYDTQDGFFLKSTYHKFKASEPTIVKEALILTHPAEVYKLRASYGPIETYQSVPNDVLSSVVQYGEDVWDKSESSMHRQVVHNMDVSAHLVGGSRLIRQSNPKLQLLVHARPLSRHHIQERIFSYYNVTQVWCARLFVSLGKEQYTSACILNKDTNACVVGMNVPNHWWDVEEKLLDTAATNSSSRSYPYKLDEDVLVFYDLSRMEGNQECASVSNIIAPAQGPPDNSEKKFITALKLVQDKRQLNKYTERRSQNLSFHIPVTDLAPGDKIEVPVFLEPHSSLKSFFVQVQVRGNIAIEGASTDLNSPWMVFFEAGDKDSVATVTAMLKENHEPSHQDKAEEVMRWQFRVPLGSGASSTARIMWIVDYDRHGLARDAFYFPEGFKVTAKFHVLPDTSVQIIPVLKERSLLNTAILSGEILRHELNIFSVAQDNTFRDVTKDSYCRSLNPQVVKVSTLCSEVYLDGSETHGSKNVTIVVRSGDHLAELSVRVWVPEPNLDIQLSDYRLSQVRRWKVPQKSYLKTRYLRSADPRHPDLFSMWNSTISRSPKKANPSRSCVLKYQQSLIEVYARFIISSPGEGIEYFRSKKTLVLVTDLVVKHLRTENSNVARIVHNTLQGVSPGMTSVQVISPTGQILGSREVRVGKDKVDIERLMVRVISAMRIRIDKIENVPGALLATVSLQDQLVAKQQEAVLDIALEFKDGTVLPLSSIDPEDYDLRVSSVNNDIVEVNEVKASFSYKPPSIKAIGDGKGEIIKVMLKEQNSCSRKKIRTLDTEYVHVQVDFAKEIFSNLVQSDSHYAGNHDHWNQNKNAYFTEQEKLNNESKFPKSEPKVHPVGEKSDSVTDSDEESGITREPKSEALEQPVSTKAKHPTPLEVAMYVLVAVFVFAILVFTANCAVFMMRHQRKCKPHSKGMSSKVVTGSISQAPDWVWIGRATLERQGAGNAGVDHALMAEEDFNGNQMVLPNLTTTGSASSKHSSTRKLNSISRSGSSSSSSGCPTTSASSGSSGSNRNSMVSTYQGSECSIRITSNPLPEDVVNNDLGGMGYNEAEWDYEAMGMTYEQLMDYFDNLKESSA